MLVIRWLVVFVDINFSKNFTQDYIVFAGGCHFITSNMIIEKCRIQFCGLQRIVSNHVSN